MAPQVLVLQLRRMGLLGELVPLGRPTHMGRVEAWENRQTWCRVLLEIGPVLGKDRLGWFRPALERYWLNGGEEIEMRAAVLSPEGIVENVIVVDSEPVLAELGITNYRLLGDLEVADIGGQLEELPEDQG